MVDDDTLTIAECEEIIPVPESTTRWYESITFDDAKVFIRENIASASRSFIAVGYYLKFVRDHSLYVPDGYESIWNFAEVEYGISKSTASRYMTMNDRFSEHGNSPIVSKEYKEFGKSQLQEMLYLTDEQIERVTPDTQVKQIRAIRSDREIPYIEIPGQMNISDFLEGTPEDIKISIFDDIKQSGTCNLTIKDFNNTNVHDAGVATSQQDSQIKIEFFELREQKTIDDAYGATWAEAVGEYLQIIHERDAAPGEIQEIKFSSFGHDYNAVTTECEGYVTFKVTRGTVWMAVSIERLMSEYQYWYPDTKKNPDTEKSIIVGELEGLHEPIETLPTTCNVSDINTTYDIDDINYEIDFISMNIDIIKRNENPILSKPYKKLKMKYDAMMLLKEDFVNQTQKGKNQQEENHD